MPEKPREMSMNDFTSTIIWLFLAMLFQLLFYYAKDNSKNVLCICFLVSLFISIVLLIESVPKRLERLERLERYRSAETDFEQYQKEEVKRIKQNIYYDGTKYVKMKNRKQSLFQNAPHTGLRIVNK